MFTNAVFLNAYRFSTYEIKKMEWLKQLFILNGYEFNPDRFPEVYYDERRKVRSNLPDPDHDHIHEGTPDFLGIYTYNANPGLCGESSEGVIVLFKDRIENYCKNTGLDEGDVRFVVLMHELGHWLTHWAKYPAAKTSNVRWTYGYNLKRRRTHEALAQLIAYWAADGNPNHENVLFELSPKVGGVVDPASVYGGYIDLVGKSKSKILEKVGQLRMFWVFNDDRMMEFLLNPVVDIMVWINTHPDIPKAPSNIKDNAWKEWIEEGVRKDLIENFDLKFCCAGFLELESNKTLPCLDFYPLLVDKIYSPINSYEELADYMHKYFNPNNTRNIIDLYKLINNNDDMMGRFIETYKNKYDENFSTLNTIKELTEIDGIVRFHN